MAGGVVRVVTASSSEHTEDLDGVFQTEKFAVEEMIKSEALIWNL